MTTEPQTAAPKMTVPGLTLNDLAANRQVPDHAVLQGVTVGELRAALAIEREARSGLDAGADIWNLCCLVDIEPTRAAAALADPAKLRRLGVKDRRDADGQAAAFLATVMGAAALASSGEAAPVDGLRALAKLSAKATPGPWIRRWASLDVHHMTGDDALQAQADIDFAVAACAYVRAALAREEADDGRS